MLAFQVPAVRVPTPVIPVYDPDNREVPRVPEVMLLALVVSVVAEAAKPEMSDAAGCAHTGAADADPVPVWLRNSLVVVVLPASLDNVLVALE